ncbi:MAG: hypothetical protein HFI73_03545 [Bacilli bacterium]|jgi:hypothetical protein|nr:hypothetical protein [Bacilli bacterium]
MEILNILLPIIVNILLIVLLVCGIILLIKCIYIIDKIKAIALNVEEKVNSLNSLFAIISLVSEKVTGLTEKCVIAIENFFVRLLNRKDEEELTDEEEELKEILKKERKK